MISLNFRVSEAELREVRKCFQRERDFLRSAFVPYLEQAAAIYVVYLNNWIYSGKVKFPYKSDKYLKWKASSKYKGKDPLYLTGALANSFIVWRSKGYKTPGRDKVRIQIDEHAWGLASPSSLSSDPMKVRGYAQYLYLDEVLFKPTFQEFMRVEAPRIRKQIIERIRNNWKK